MVKVDMIILFGSYARGDWVEDLHPDGMNMHEYKSDLDLMVVVKHESLVDKIEKKTSLTDVLDREVKTPVSLLPEDIYFLNKRISEGHYFYKDILEEGILLFDSGKLKLETPRDLNKKDRKQLAIDDFDYWFNSAQKFLDYFTFGFNREDYNHAAFQLHQAAEKLYSTLLLVVTYYKPNSHDLEKLHKRIISFTPIIYSIFPRNTDEEKRLFELLRKAYVDARYKKTYKITREELQELGQRVERLKDLTESICQKAIESFSEAE